MADIEARGVVIDADAHVIETDRTWDFLEKSEAAFPARRIVSADERRPEHPLLADRRQARRSAHGGDERLRRRQAHGDARLAPRRRRLGGGAQDGGHRRPPRATMTELGIDVQVLHNSVWIEQLTDRPGHRGGARPQLEPLARRHLGRGGRSAALDLRRAGALAPRRARRDPLREGARGGRRLHAPLRRRPDAPRPELSTRCSRARRAARPVDPRSTSRTAARASTARAAGRASRCSTASRPSAPRRCSPATASAQRPLEGLPQAALGLHRGLGAMGAVDHERAPSRRNGSHYTATDNPFRDFSTSTSPPRRATTSPTSPTSSVRTRS